MSSSSSRLRFKRACIPSYLSHYIVGFMMIVTHLDLYAVRQCVLDRGIKASALCDGQ